MFKSSNKHTISTKHHPKQHHQRPKSKKLQNRKPKPQFTTLSKSTSNSNTPHQTGNLNLNNIPILDLDDFFPMDNESTSDSQPNPMVTYNPRTVLTAPGRIKNSVALVTKSCCSLCVLPFETIKKAHKRFPNTFNYIQIDLEDPDNFDEYRGRYKYHIPVVLINGKVFSKGKFDEFVNEFDQIVLDMSNTPQGDYQFISKYAKKNATNEGTERDQVSV